MWALSAHFRTKRPPLRISVRPVATPRRTSQVVDPGRAWDEFKPSSAEVAPGWSKLGHLPGVNQPWGKFGRRSPNLRQSWRGVRRPIWPRLAEISRSCANLAPGRRLANATSVHRSGEWGGGTRSKTFTKGPNTCRSRCWTCDPNQIQATGSGRESRAPVNRVSSAHCFSYYRVLTHVCRLLAPIRPRQAARCVSIGRAVTQAGVGLRNL